MSEFLKFTPLEYLKIDMANNFSKKLDHSNFEERINWWDENQNRLNLIIDEAKNPALFYAGLQAYKCYKSNTDTGYLIGLDAASSGIQLLTILINCKTSAKTAGYIDNQRVDIYSTLYGRMNNDKYSHEQVKLAIMTSFFSSKKEPRKLFGDNTPDLKQFYNILETSLPGCRLLNLGLESLWNNNALIHEWELPDNYQVKIPVKEKVEAPFKFLNKTRYIQKEVNKTSDNYRSLAANCVHSIDSFIVREIHRRVNYDPEQLVYTTSLFGSSQKEIEERGKDIMVNKLWNLYQKTNILSLRIIDYLDEFNIHLINTEVLANLINKLPLKKFELLSIHD